MRFFSSFLQEHFALISNEHKGKQDFILLRSQSRRGQLCWEERHSQVHQQLHGQHLQWDGQHSGHGQTQHGEHPGQCQQQNWQHTGHCLRKQHQVHGQAYLYQETQQLKLKGLMSQEIPCPVGRYRQ